MTLTEIRDIIRYAIGEVLGLADPVSDDDDLFDLGAESIDVPKVVVTVEKICGVQLTSEDLKVVPTVSGIADAVVKAKKIE